MEILYIWIEHFRSIHYHGYNLNSKYNISYSKDDNEIKIQKRMNLDSLLYGENITVSAIVGDNGAGKSTVLDAIQSILLEPGKKVLGFIIYLKDGNLYYRGKIRRKVPLESLEIKKDPVVDDTIIYSNLIYYSDLLVARYCGNEVISNNIWKNIIYKDISTSYLLKAANDKKTGEFNSEEKNILSEYFDDDIKRQIQFCTKAYDKSIPINVPKSARFLIDSVIQSPSEDNLASEVNTYLIRFMGKIETARTQNKGGFFFYSPDGFPRLSEILNKMEFLVQRNIEEDKELLQQFNDWDELPLFSFNWHIFLLCLNYGIENGVGNVYFINLCRDLYENVSKEICDCENFRACTILNDYFNYHFMKDPKLNRYYQLYIAFIKICRNGENADFKVDHSFTGSYLEPYSFTSNHEDVFNFVDLYLQYLPNDNFIKILWNMSSGEQNLFSLFARLDSAISSEQKNHIVLLDELDNSFHPKWQQTILNELTKYLRSCYPDSKFQIILTTHSPVLLSDIPKENVCFLYEKAEELEQHEETFAANIASLYYDSFFMENGSVGEIAKNTIINLFKAIQQYDKNLKDVDPIENFVKLQFPENLEYSCIVNKKNIERLISSIGEDIWRSKLTEHYQHYLAEDEAPDELAVLIQKLEKLKGTGKEKELYKRINTFLEDSNQ